VKNKPPAASKPEQPKPKPKPGETPWTAIVVIGVVVALIAWAASRGSDSSPPSASAGASSAQAADGGLGIEELVVGDGPEAAVGDKVKVHYRGTLTDGTEFDSSKKHDRPFDFKIGAGRVIKGWDQGVPGMKVGGKRKLTVPAKLGYGERGHPPVIPANATLLFEIELLEVAKDGASPSAASAANPSADDPLAGKFTLADATKNVKGTGALVAKIDTSMGALDCKLYDDKAPVTVANFIGLATGERTWKDPATGKWVQKPAYDGTTFHRVIKGFMIQGGDPKGDGSGEPGYVIKDEVWEGAKHDRTGLLCMANRGPNTNGAQFFIMDEPTASLDGGYTIFGECAPAKVIHDIASVPKSPSDKPTTPVTIKSVKISRAAKP
jgi:peptidyl-prolyl cis-trans isomerase A (cyclophilin A)